MLDNWVFTVCAQQRDVRLCYYYPSTSWVRGSLKINAGYVFYSTYPTDSALTQIYVSFKRLGFDTTLVNSANYSENNQPHEDAKESTRAMSKMQLKCFLETFTRTTWESLVFWYVLLSKPRVGVEIGWALHIDRKDI